MNPVEIEEAVSNLVLEPFDRAEFPFQFLRAFGQKDTALARLRAGNTNQSDVPGAILQRGNIHVAACDPGAVDETLKALRESPKFGMNIGSIQSRYLFGQGAYLEIRSPLANRRQRLSLAALGSTLRDLQSSQNPFARFSAAPTSQALSADAADSELVASLTSRIQDVDYELIVSTALRQASEAADALRSLEGIDEATYADIRGELATLRQELQANLATINAMFDGAGLSEDESLSAKIAPLRVIAQQRAEELGEQLKKAQSEYAQRWYAERELFERALYASACKASEQLLSFADSETLAIILAGLGDEGVRIRPDRVHMLPIGELRQCAIGAIDSTEIKAVVYSY